MSHRAENRFAWVTPSGRGGVATLICSGPRTAETLVQLFRPAFRYSPPLPRNRPLFGYWSLSEQPRIEEEVVVVQGAETQFELHCHGGIAIQTAVGSGLELAGFQARSWIQWLRETNLDPLQAEAQIALAVAPTTQTAARLLAQYRGVLRTELQSILAQVEVGELDAAAQRLDRLVATQEIGLHLTQPWKIVLTGAPNVGKSRLLNALLGYQRAIVRDEPGTTRDVLLGTTSYHGWPIQLMDTAGVRPNPADDIEAHGMAQVAATVRAADLVLQVRELGGAPHLPLPPGCIPRRVLGVTNKGDLADRAEPTTSPDLLVSALTGQGLEGLMDRIVETLIVPAVAPDEPLLFTPELVCDMHQVHAALATREIDRSCQLLRKWCLA